MSNITGVLHSKGATQVVSDKFSKRDLVIKTTDTYPQFISLQLTQDKCQLLDAVNVGDSVTANYNLRGREWTAPDGTVKYFNTIECWKIEVQGKAPAQVSDHVPDNADSEQLPF